MQSKQILLTLIAFAFASAHANPLVARQDTTAKLPCTYTEYEGGGEDEGPAEEVTTTIDSRRKCVYAANSLDFCGCNSKDALDRPGCWYACTDRCDNDCLGGNN